MYVFLSLYELFYYILVSQAAYSLLSLLNLGHSNLEETGYDSIAFL
jgi:hypothetical protein